MNRRVPLERRATLKRTAFRIGRPLGRRRKATRRQRLVPRDWTPQVFALNTDQDGRVECVVSHEPAEQAHHAFEVQWLDRHGLGYLAADPRIGVPVTELAHVRHTRAVARIPRRRLPASVEAVVAEQPAGIDEVLRCYLERHYA